MENKQMSLLPPSPPPPPPPPCHQSSWVLISQGAEARIWYIPNFFTFHSHDQQQSNCGDTVVSAICKERFSKAYRHATLDKTLTKARTKAEARNIVKSRKAGIETPTIYSVQLAETCACLFMEYVQGCTIKHYLEKHVAPYNHDPSSAQDFTHSMDIDTDFCTKRVVIDTHSLRIAHRMGVIIATMHQANIIHGDLTTSNIMIRNPPSSHWNTEESWDPQLVLIDFGLSTTCSASTKKHDNNGGSISGQEDKAVDLYVLERAFQTSHPGSEPLISHFLLAYQQTIDNIMPNSSNLDEGFRPSTLNYGHMILERLNQVRLRGRKRECFG